MYVCTGVCVCVYVCVHVCMYGCVCAVDILTLTQLNSILGIFLIFGISLYDHATPT